MIDKITFTQYNRVRIDGALASDIQFEYRLFQENFYITRVEIPRFSGNKDVIPVTIPEKLLRAGAEGKPDHIKILGELRSYHIPDQLAGKKKLLLKVFAKSIDPYGAKTEGWNEILLSGFVCKQPIYRTTPLGKKITETLIAVNRKHGKADYIPCIFWGDDAEAMSDCKVGSRISINGRIQSRVYEKMVGDTLESRMAYEVSVMKYQERGRGME